MEIKCSIIICTYRREKVLVNTIKKLIEQKEKCDYETEIIVVDQKPNHKKEVKSYLEYKSKGKFKYVKMRKASLTAARNYGCKKASGEILVYLDDDIIPKKNIIKDHIETHKKYETEVVAGQVLDEDSKPKRKKGSFSHNEFEKEWYRIYGCNFSIKKDFYVEMGGSDENLGVHSYSEDVILSKKIFSNGGGIVFNPAASVVHLTHPRGGCRISDESQPTEEWEKSFSKVYFALHYANDVSTALSTLKAAIRQGPLRKENVMRPWRQPIAWYGFLKAIRKSIKGDRTC
jgi:GT2 family glycosyltransferase